MKKVGIIVGSIRQHSLSGLVAQNLAKLLEKDVEVEVIDIADLPLYNQDFDSLEVQPAAYVAFRNKIKNVDGRLAEKPVGALLFKAYQLALNGADTGNRNVPVRSNELIAVVADILAHFFQVFHVEQ